ncbi:MAG: T9SS type A sorting domain-containing protein, partial [Saprospiraceae bacterium]|nr:T9SS type A sorting domain-containing protein [Saprospiraceae bacterium]
TKVNVELMSEDGKIIHTLVNNLEQEPNMYVLEIPIDTYDLNNGMHYIRLSENGNVKTKKVIVQH